MDNAAAILRVWRRNEKGEAEYADMPILLPLAPSEDGKHYTAELNVDMANRMFSNYKDVPKGLGVFLG